MSPSLAMPRDQLRQEPRMLGADIQCRNILVLLPAGAHENVAILDVNFLERLEAIDGESRANHRHVTDAASRHLRQHTTRVRAQPAGRAEPRLKAHAPLR